MHLLTGVDRGLFTTRPPKRVLTDGRVGLDWVDVFQGGVIVECGQVWSIASKWEGDCGVGGRSSQKTAGGDVEKVDNTGVGGSKNGNSIDGN